MKFGTDASEDFLRACKEHAEVAPSSAHAIELAWNTEEKRQATMGEALKYAKACCDSLTKQLVELKAKHPERKKRKTQTQPQPQTRSTLNHQKK